MWQNKKYLYFILISMCFLVYSNSLNNEFVSDDLPAIINDPFISHPLHYWLEPHPLLNSLNYIIAKASPFIYHLTSIILHSINTLLIFYFLSLFFKAEGSFLGAALFAVHPIHTEAITWISGRSYVITSLFVLCAYFLYQYSTSVNKEFLSGRAKRIKIIYYLLSLFIFSYYLTANFSFYFVFPLFLILSDVTFGKWRKNWKWWLPFLAIVILRISMARAIISERVVQVAKDMGKPLAWTNPVFNFTYSFFSHLGLLLWPAKLTLYHEPPVISLFALRAGIIALVFLLISAPFIFKKARELFYGVGIFVLFLAPTYSPVTVSWLVAERYLYFPSVMLSIFLAFFYERIIGNVPIFNLLNREQKNRNVPFIFKEAGLMLVLLAIAGLAVRTVARNEDWKTPNRFWRQTALVSKNSPRAHNNLGDAYSQEGNTDRAIMEFKKAIELEANYADAYHNLATTYYRIGNIDEAIKSYQQAVSFDPDLFESRLNLGLIYLNKGIYNLAQAQLNEAIRLRPQDATAKAALEMVNKSSN